MEEGKLAKDSLCGGEVEVKLEEAEEEQYEKVEEVKGGEEGEEGEKGEIIHTSRGHKKVEFTFL